MTQLYDNAMKDWAAIVDAVSAEVSTSPLSGPYTPEAYLPSSDRGIPPLTDALLETLVATQKQQYLREGPQGWEEEGEATPWEESKTLFERASDRLFRPQLSMAESLRGIPMVDHFRSLAVDRRHKAEDEQTQESHVKGKESEVSEAVDESDSSLFGPEGPNFYRTYSRLHQALDPRRRRVETTGRQTTQSLRLSTGESPFGPMPPPPLPMRAESSSRLNAGFRNPRFYAEMHREPDFMPIILVPPSITAPIQLLNVKHFLEEGQFVDPTNYFIDRETGASNVQQAKPQFEFVSSSRFRYGISTNITFTNFRVVDDPKRVDNWQHVCAALVNGKDWQLEDWFPQENDRRIVQPSYLFRNISGFLPYFEEDPVPKAVQEWNVLPLVLTKRGSKSQQHIREAARFWENLYKFMAVHPLFHRFTVKESA